MSPSRACALWAVLQGAVAIVPACRGQAGPAGDGGPPAVSAVVTKVRGSLESVRYVAVKTEFRNASSAPVRVRSYAIDWPDGRFVESDVALDLPPSGVVSRTVEMGFESGQIDRLTMSNARVSILDAR